MANPALKKVLYVDDDPEIRALVEMSLKLGGLTVELCSSGGEALEKAAGFHPDLILLDVMMPGMDGPTTFARLRDDPALAAVPVVFMTAAKEASALRALGAIDVLFKPFDSLHLAEQIKGIWERHMQASRSRPSDASGGAPLLTASEQLQGNYIDGLPKRLHALQQIWNHLLHVDWSDANLQILINIIHNLKGSGASFGFNDISRLAGEMESLIDAMRDTHSVPAEAQRLQFGRFVQQLTQLVAEASSGRGTVASAATVEVRRDLAGTSQPPRLVYIADADVDVAAWLAFHLRQNGFRTQSFRRPEDLMAACLEQRPDALVSEVVFPHGEDVGLKTIGNLLKTTPVPTLFMSARADIKARLVALRLGAAGYLSKPLDVGQLLGKLQDQMGGDLSEPFRVLLIDDDEVTAKYHAAVLTAEGIVCQVLTEPLRVMQPLLGFRPELILMDLHMPKISGLELAQLIRQEDAYANLPIYFLSADTNERSHFSAVASGGDYYIDKPIVPAEFVAVIKSRLKRVRAVNRRIDYIAQRDVVTGVLNRACFLSRLETALFDNSGAAAVLFVTIDNFPVLADSIPPSQLNQFVAGLAQALRELLQEGDLLGRYSDSSFMLFVRRPERETINQLALELREFPRSRAVNVDGHAVTFTLSVGLQRSDGRPAYFLLSVARFLAHRAHGAGGDQVLMDETTVGEQERYQHEQNYLRAIHAALEGGDCEFRLLLRPAIGLKDGSASCYEALLGLHDVSGGQYPLQEIIATGYRHGLADALDRRLLELALPMLLTGVAQRNNEKLIVKIAVASLLKGDVLHLVQAGLTSKAARARLVFMFSFREAWSDMEKFQHAVPRLKQIGCSVGMDEFPVDDDALQWLDNLPLDYVKLDPYAMTALETNTDTQARFTTILARSHKNGVKVLVQHEERSSTMAYLTNSDVDYIQGNFLMEPDDYVTLEVITMDESNTRERSIWLK